MSRRDSREAIVKIIFQNEFIDKRLRPDAGPDAVELSPEEMAAMYVTTLDEGDAEKLDMSFVIRGISSVLDNAEEIDAIIVNHIEKSWTLNRLCKVDLAILRVAIAEIKYIDDIPAGVSANEAVDIAKKFSYPESGAFINGILGSVIRQ